MENCEQNGVIYGLAHPQPGRHTYIIEATPVGYNTVQRVQVDYDYDPATGMINKVPGTEIILGPAEEK